MNTPKRFSAPFLGFVRSRGALLVRLAAVAMMAPGVALAQAPEVQPVPESGRQLAIRLCSNCHYVENATANAIPAGIPSLKSIANQPGQSGDRITGFLLQPHPPMPELRLSVNEIKDLLAYLETLRNGSGAPLIDLAPRKTPSSADRS
jgi:mono/diheme cytochrome c family protein